MISIFFEAFLPSETDFKTKKLKEKFSSNENKEARPLDVY